MDSVALNLVAKCSQSFSALLNTVPYLAVYSGSLPVSLYNWQDTR